LQNVSIPNVLVRDLPEPVHAVLTQRAAAQGVSLQQYLTAELGRLAERPTSAEVLARVARRSGGRIGLAAAVRDVAAERR
jgi:antitoxin FitA